MPVFKTHQLSAAEADTAWGNLGSSFGVVTTTASTASILMPGAAGDPVRISSDKQLEMAEGSGLYAFTNLQ